VIKLESYTVVKKGVSVHHCLNIPQEFLDKELEITVRPILPGKNLRSRIERILKENDDIKPFSAIADPSKWQKEIRSDW
jgi:hypothetical protein